MNTDFDETMPTVTADGSQCGSDADFVVQRYSPEARVWRDWDCAYSRAEADRLLAAYERRYRALGLDWRIARIVYVPPKPPVHEELPEPEHCEELTPTA
jgi:hypothetical protein